MLIEFSVSNFLSFREKQTFSMVAAPRLRKKENVFVPVVKGEKIPALLKIAAIYGPNASGKSNLIKALSLVRTIARRQPSTADVPLPVKQFRFDRLLANEPSRFEFHFIEAEQRYEFVLAATPERIVEERLVAYPQGKETLLYERRHSATGDEYQFGRQLEGGKELHETWRKLTGPKVMFIAQAVANSSEDLNQLRTPFRWLQGSIFEVSGDMENWAETSQVLAKFNPALVTEISSFLRKIDVPITDIQFEPLTGSNAGTALGGMASGIRMADALPSKSATPETKTTLIHKTLLGEAPFDFNEESSGTQNLIGFWLPWRALSGSNSFRILAVDELDSSLHPIIVASLLKQHLESDLPKQLIFTTHDTHIMDTKLLRRDQFWLTERDANGATQLRSIHDFEGREGEDLEKRYYEGRYRGLPFVREN